MVVDWGVVKDVVDVSACVVDIFVVDLNVEIEGVIGTVLVDVDRTGLATLHAVS